MKRRRTAVQRRAPRRWEYWVTRVACRATSGGTSVDNVQMFLYREGLNGWELVVFIPPTTDPYGTFILKRPLS